MEAYVQVSGNVGKEVEYRSANGGMDEWATFRLAHTSSYRRGTEWVDRPTTWLTVNCRRRLAWNVQGSLRTGDRVIVHGRLRTKTWVDGRTGEEREQHLLEADVVGHDLNFGTTNFRRTPRRDETASSGHPGRGGDDPWAAAPSERPGEDRDAEVHEFPQPEPEPEAEVEVDAEVEATEPERDAEPVG